jgi:hypothetical protein
VRGLAALCLAAAGCAGVFDLEYVADPEPPLPLESRVTGTGVTHVISNDVQREPAVTDVPFEAVWHVILDDGREPTVEQSTGGAFTFLRASDTQAYRLYTNVVGYHLEVDSDATTQVLSAPSWGRPDRESPDVNTGLEYRITGVPSSGTARVNTTGLWTSTGGAPPDAFRIEWTNAVSLDGTVGILRASKNDRAYWVFDQSQGAYTATVGYRSDDIEMTQGQTFTVSEAYTAANRDQCIRVTVPLGDELQRLAAAGIGPANGLSGYWAVSSTATPDLSPGIGFFVASSAGTSNVEDLDVQVANPYAGHSLLVTAAVGRQRFITAEGALNPVAVADITQYFVVPSTTCTVSTTVAANVAIATNIRLDDMAWTDDNSVLAADRSKPFTLAWDVSDGLADGFRVDLLKVAAIGTATSIQLAGRWHTRNREIVIDPPLLDPLGTYVALIDIESGRPNGTADSTISYPFAYSFVSSASFRVPGPSSRRRNRVGGGGFDLVVGAQRLVVPAVLADSLRVLLAHETLGLRQAVAHALEVFAVLVAPQPTELLEHPLLVLSPPLAEPLRGERAVAERTQCHDAGLVGRRERLAHDGFDAEAAQLPVMGAVAAARDDRQVREVMQDVLGDLRRLGGIVDGEDEQPRALAAGRVEQLDA